jgi:hypothetical protein
MAVFRIETRLANATVEALIGDRRAGLAAAGVHSSARAESAYACRAGDACTLIALAGVIAGRSIPEELAARAVSPPLHTRSARLIVLLPAPARVLVAPGVLPSLGSIAHDSAEYAAEGEPS